MTKKTKKSDHHIFFIRILVRIFIGVLFLQALFFINERFYESYGGKYFLIGLVLGSLMIDMIGRYWKKLPSFYSRIHQSNNHFSARTLFIVGSVLALYFYHPIVAIVAICMTLVGTIGGAILRKFHIKIFPVSQRMQGLIMAFFLNGCVGILFGLRLEIIIPMALIASFIEGYATFDEDELLIPVFAGAVGQLVITCL